MFLIVWNPTSYISFQGNFRPDTVTYLLRNRLETKKSWRDNSTKIITTLSGKLFEQPPAVIQSRGSGINAEGEFEVQLSIGRFPESVFLGRLFETVAHQVDFCRDGQNV